MEFIGGRLYYLLIKSVGLFYSTFYYEYILLFRVNKALVFSFDIMLFEKFVRKH